MDAANKGKKLSSDYEVKDLEAIAGVMGKKYALNHVMSESDKKIAKAYGDYDKFYDGYKAIKKFGATTKASKGVALAESGADKKLFEAYNIGDEERKNAKEYFKNGGSTEEFTQAEKILTKAKVKRNSYKEIALELARNDAPDRLYQAYNIYGDKVQAARALNISAKEYSKLREKANTDGNTSLSKAEITSALNKSDLSTNQKAAAYNLLASWRNAYKGNPYGQPTVKSSGKHKLKGASGSPKGGSSTASSKAGQVDYTTPEAREFMDNFGANMDKERRRVGEKLYRAAQSSVRGINAPYKNDKDYLPKETLQVVRSGDERLDTEALKALKGGGIKALVKQAQKNLPKIKEPDDNTTFDDGDSSGGGRGYYRRYGRRGHGRGGSGGSGSSGTATKKPEELKTKDVKYNPSTWSPTAVSTDSGWTDAQIRKVYNTLIKQGLTQEQAVARIAQLWHTRFS